MGMFVIESGVKSIVVKDGAEWTLSGNFKDFTTTKVNVFDKGELVIDPTNISKYACTPSFRTIGGQYAKAGWFGFRSGGWILLVPGNHVQYV